MKLETKDNSYMIHFYYLQLFVFLIKSCNCIEFIYILSLIYVSIIGVSYLFSNFLLELFDYNDCDL